MLKHAFQIALGFTLLIVLVFGVALVYGWFGQPDGSGGNFCEAVHEGLILQPTNSFSNIGFVLSGLVASWLISHRHIHRSGFFFSHPFIPLFYCLLTILLGPCSMAMHATETRLGGLFDMNSMYLYAAFIFSYALTRYFSLSTWLFITAFIACLVICNIAGTYSTFGFIDFYPGSAFFGFFCGLGILFEFLNLKKHQLDMKFRYVVGCVLSFLIGFTVWQFGWDGHCLCDPESWFQWHGVWHLLCALSTYFLFLYYTSEQHQPQ